MGGGGGLGLNAFYWYQIFALDSAVVEVQEMFSLHGGHLTNAMLRPKDLFFPSALLFLMSIHLLYYINKISKLLTKVSKGAKIRN